jgi:hypothetical protein
MQAFTLFSHQLYPEIADVPKYTVMCLIEDASLFKKGGSAAKAIFHRAALQAVRERLLVKGFVVRYFGADEYPKLEDVMQAIAKSHPELLRFYELGSSALEKKLITLLHEHNIPYQILPSPAPRMMLTQSSRFVPKVLPPIEPNRYVEEAAAYYFDLVDATEVEFAYPVTRGDTEEWLEALPVLVQKGHSKEVIDDLAPLLNSGLLTLGYIESHMPPERWKLLKPLLG